MIRRHAFAPVGALDGRMRYAPTAVRSFTPLHRSLQLLHLAQPKVGGGIGGHLPSATRRQADGANGGAVEGGDPLVPPYMCK